MSTDHPHIWINGRFVSHNDIQTGNESPRTKFEKSTFDFLREWLNGEEQFSIHTSGSTGTPKTIMISRQQMIASAQLTIEALNLKPDTAALLCIDTQYIGGRMMIVRSLVNRMSLWAVDPDAYPLQKLPFDQCVNFAAFVPYQVQQMLVSKHPHLLNGLDTVLIGGASLSEEYVSLLKAFQCRCFATYGMTETISHIALRQLNGKDSRDFFEALPGIELAVDDRECLVIKAPYLIEPVITNDRVELLNNRQFRWVGRWDNVINTGGVKVSPEKIEAIIQPFFHDAGITSQFFIHGIEDKLFGWKVCLVIEAADSSIKEKLESVLSEVSKIVHPYEMPRAVFISPGFAMTNTGKINRLESLRKVKESFSIKN